MTYGKQDWWLQSVASMKTSLRAIHRSTKAVHTRYLLAGTVYEPDSVILLSDEGLTGIHTCCHYLGRLSGAEQKAQR